MAIKIAQEPEEINFLFFFKLFMWSWLNKNLHTRLEDKSYEMPFTISEIFNLHVKTSIGQEVWSSVTINAFRYFIMREDNLERLYFIGN